MIDEAEEIEAIPDTQPSLYLPFETALFVSIIYPFLFLVIAWIITDNGFIGDLSVFEPAEFNSKLFLSLLFICEFILFYQMSKASGSLVLAWFIIACIVAAIGSYYMIDAFSVNAAFRVVAALAILAVFVVTGASAVVIIATTAVVVIFIGAFEIVSTYIIVYTTAYIVAGEAAYLAAFALTFLLLFLMAYTVVSTLTIIYQKLKDSLNTNGHVIMFWVSTWLVLLVIVTSSLYLIEFKEYFRGIDVSYSLLLLLGFIPLFNAPLNAYALKFTRRTFKSARLKSKNFLYMRFFDGVTAVVFVFLVILSGLLTLLAISILNWLVQQVNGETVIEITNLWQQLRNNDWTTSLWLWLMLASTLMPALYYSIELIGSKLSGAKPNSDVGSEYKED